MSQCVLCLLSKKYYCLLSCWSAQLQQADPSLRSALKLLVVTPQRRSSDGRISISIISVRCENKGSQGHGQGADSPVIWENNQPRERKWIRNLIYTLLSILEVQANAARITLSRRLRYFGDLGVAPSSFAWRSAAHQNCDFIFLFEWYDLHPIN